MTLLEVMDRLQDLQAENDMQDLPVYIYSDQGHLVRVRPEYFEVRQVEAGFGDYAAIVISP